MMSSKTHVILKYVSVTAGGFWFQISDFEEALKSKMNGSPMTILGAIWRDILKGSVVC
jgi:hypothetical protein